jgi:AP-3 complex subunit mu
MIQSLFVLNSTGEVIIEKHWRGNARREDTVTFWTAMLGALRVPSDLPPFIPTVKGSVLVHLHRAGLFFLASVGADTPPLSATHFLDTLAETLHDYFGEVNEHAIKDNFITVYELLDELLDSGFPLTVEQNILKQLVPPPTYLTKVIGSYTGDSTSGTTKLPFPTASPLTPWRREGIRYAQNEIFVDVCETIDAIFSTTGTSSNLDNANAKPKLTHALIRGDVRVNCRLSGNPDISMSFRSVARVDDTALHHCARHRVFQETGTLSFVPPDGRFTLMSYVIRDHAAFALPVHIQPSIRVDLSSLSAAVSIAIRPRFSHPCSPYSTGAAVTTSSAASAAAATVQSAANAASLGGSIVLAQVIAASERLGVSGMVSNPNVSTHSLRSSPNPFTNSSMSSASFATNVAGPSSSSSISGGGGASTVPLSNVLEDVEVTIPFGTGVASVSLSANVGTVQFESTTGTCRWIVGSVERTVTPCLTGSVTLVAGTASAGMCAPPVTAKFRAPGLAVSGMYVDRLELGPSEPYKYFKGLRCVTSAGRYECRQDAKH